MLAPPPSMFKIHVCKYVNVYEGTYACYFGLLHRCLPLKRPRSKVTPLFLSRSSSPTTDTQQTFGAKLKIIKIDSYILAGRDLFAKWDPG